MRRHHLGRTAPQLSDAIGIGVRYTGLRDFTGSEVDAEDATGHDVTAIEQPTRMHTGCQAGVITGCHGGFENVLTLGLSVDTLDFEPDPYSGLLAQEGQIFFMNLGYAF